MRSVLLPLALLVAGSLAVPVYSQVGQDMKDLGHDSKTASEKGATKAGHAVKKGATKSTHAAKTGVHKTATAVSDGTRDTSTH